MIQSTSALLTSTRPFLLSSCTACRHASVSTAQASTPPAVALLGNPKFPLRKIGRPKRWKGTERVYPERKRFLVQHYTDLLSRSALSVFLRSSDLDTSEWNAVRTALKAIPPPAAGDAAAIRLTVLKSGLLAPTFRALPSYPRQGIEPYMSDQLALLTFSTLHPPTLAAALKILSKASAKPNTRKAAAPAAKGAKPAIPVAEERLLAVTALAEDQALTPAKVADLSTMPALETLQGQIAGLIEGTLRNVVGVVASAGGGAVVQTLDGYRRGLDEGSETVA